MLACPVIFTADMRSGRSLQAIVEAMRGASLAIQFIRKELVNELDDLVKAADLAII